MQSGMQWRPDHYSRNKSKPLLRAIGTVGVTSSTETHSKEPWCKQCHMKGKLILPLHKLLKLQAGMQDRKGLPCTWCNPFHLAAKPPCKIFHSYTFSSASFSLCWLETTPTSCQSRFIQATLLPTYLLCPLHKSDTLPLCPTPTRQLCPFSAFTISFWTSNALLWEVPR